jgi:phage terminase small subunit
MNTTPIPLPKNPKHQRFADLILEGKTGPEAYKQAGFRHVKGGSARTLASRLLKSVDVATYLQAVRQRAAEGTVLSVLDKREFFARVVRTPLLKIDPHGKDGDLIVKYKNTVTDDGGTVEIVKYDALKAIEQDNKLSGDDPESTALAGLAEALAGLGSGGGQVDDRM